MILMHREQRGAGVTKAWRGVRRVKRSSASRRVASCRVEDSRGQPCVKAENIAHRSDLASLWIFNASHHAEATADSVHGIVGNLIQ